MAPQETFEPDQSILIEGVGLGHDGEDHSADFDKLEYDGHELTAEEERLREHYSEHMSDGAALLLAAGRVSTKFIVEYQRLAAQSVTHARTARQPQAARSNKPKRRLAADQERTLANWNPTGDPNLN